MIAFQGPAQHPPCLLHELYKASRYKLRLRSAAATRGCIVPPTQDYVAVANTGFEIETHLLSMLLKVTCRVSSRCQSARLYMKRSHACELVDELGRAGIALVPGIYMADMGYMIMNRIE